jgi:hypothetical protein
MKFLDMGYAAYSNPGTSNTFIPWAGASSTICSWITPCYKQFSTTYNWATCWVWCGPVAWWIIMWYYDRNWKSNLILWNASITNDTTVNVMIREIWTAMLTSCSNWEWSTYRTNIKNAVDYAIGKGYTGSTSNYSWIVSTLTIFSKVKTEISNWKPIIIHANWSAWHFMVWFWYKSTNWTDKIVRLNMWWGNGLIDNLYPKSDIDQNLDSIYYMPWYELNVADAYTTFNIQ